MRDRILMTSLAALLVISQNGTLAGGGVSEDEDDKNKPSIPHSVNNNNADNDDLDKQIAEYMKKIRLLEEEKEKRAEREKQRLEEENKKAEREQKQKQLEELKATQKALEEELNEKSASATIVAQPQQENIGETPKPTRVGQTDPNYPQYGEIVQENEDGTIMFKNHPQGAGPLSKDSDYNNWGYHHKQLVEGKNTRFFPRDNVLMFPNEGPGAYERKKNGDFPRYEDSTQKSNVQRFTQDIAKGGNPINAFKKLF